MNIARVPTNSLYQQDFLNDVLGGLSQDQKCLSPRWLYDDAGSEFFEKITELPEYYVTRTEMRILRDTAPIFSNIIGKNVSLIEYGAGAAIKAKILLDEFINPSDYIAIDISFDHMQQAMAKLRTDYPNLNVEALSGNFLSGKMDAALSKNGPQVGFFPGSTIGNLSDKEISIFLKGAREFLGDGAYFILGADLRKSPEISIPAYDDAQGVTADFNLNLLKRINRELDGDFQLGKFIHEARWNDELSQIEMHLKSLEDQSFNVAGRGFFINSGETIHTENSRKFKKETLTKLIVDAGWKIQNFETDVDQYFAVMLLKVT